MSPRQSGVAPMPAEDTMEIANVRFPSLCSADRYTVQITTTNGTTPIRIELSSTKTQANWHVPTHMSIISEQRGRMCNIWDLSNHTPSEALYVLPTNVVATTLKDNDYTIDLVHPVNRSSYLVLKLAAFGGFTATYTFELTLLEVPSKRLSALSTSEVTEALQSQVRALKQELQVLQKDFLQAQQPHRTSPTTSPLPYLPPSPMLHVATTLSTAMDDPVRWTVHTSVPPALFTLGQHDTSIVVLKTGLYHVQARANKSRRVHLHVRANGRHMVDPSPCHFFTKKTSLEFVSRSTNHAPAEVRIVAVHVFD
ncbi:hypothetical protein DYB30_002371 [Aphanomyces astaci]|uniref:Uncharacterized protein n=1 Tax=Aphanomyces astaci TaxID=112090 RepID=A0A397EHF7_APHAT|nr:hypothetical protein DYB30_002371 [Aphanomyces astaci]